MVQSESQNDNSALDDIFLTSYQTYLRLYIISHTIVEKSDINL